MVAWTIVELLDIYSGHSFDMSVQWCAYQGRWAYRRKETPLLTDDGAAAQEARDHDQGTSQKEDIGRHGERAGGQQAQVISFINQSPDPHSHHDPSTHLKEESERDMSRLLISKEQIVRSIKMLIFTSCK